MKKVFFSILIPLTILFLITTAVAVDKATPEEAKSKCIEAAKMIKDKGIDAAIASIGDKKGPFVLKDTYVFILNMDGKMLAHPVKPELTQQASLLEMKDSAGKPLFKEFIQLAGSKGEGWVDYMWSNPGQEKPALKTSYIYKVPGTHYIVGAGIFK